MNHKIIIIGAGPSGLTTAYYLIKSGFSRKNIIILEKSDRVGGQSNTRNIDGKMVEAGTSYLTNGYKCITDIAYKVNEEIKELGGILYKPYHQEYDIPYLQSINIFRKYIAIRKREWLDKGQLYNPILKDNRLSFRDWLKKYNLEDILENPLYIAGFYAQLYGWADNVSAHSALQWLTPEILYSVISHNTRALPNGFESLWKKIAYYYELDIRYNTEVLEVIQNTQVSIKCKNKKIYTGNDVFICSDFSLYKHPLTNKIGEFEHTNVYSSRMYVDSLDDKIKEVAPYYVIDPDDIEKYEVEVSTIRNYGKNKKGKYICAACSYLGNITDIKKTRKQMRDKLKVYGINSYKIIDDFIWKYNIRYSNWQLKNKIPQLLEKSTQIWYNSGALSHWNVESISRHSIKKVKEFLDYNNFTTFYLNNYKKKSLYNKITTQNFFPEHKQINLIFDKLEDFF